MPNQGHDHERRRRLKTDIRKLRGVEQHLKPIEENQR